MIMLSPSNDLRTNTTPIRYTIEIDRCWTEAGMQVELSSTP